MEKQDFNGAKLVLVIGDQLVTILRDDRLDIVWPNMWDFPGGGREGMESPADCVLRETHEELGLALSPSALVWAQDFANLDNPAQRSWWFGAVLPKGHEDQIQFGNEGQCWQLMSPERWLNDPRAIPTFKPRLRLALVGLGL